MYSFRLFVQPFALLLSARACEVITLLTIGHSEIGEKSVVRQDRRKFYYFACRVSTEIVPHARRAQEECACNLASKTHVFPLMGSKACVCARVYV